MTLHVPSKEARGKLTQLLDAVEAGGEHVMISRWGRKADTVMVSRSWYERAALGLKMLEAVQALKGGHETNDVVQVLAMFAELPAEEEVQEAS